MFPFEIIVFSFILGNRRRKLRFSATRLSCRETRTDICPRRNGAFSLRVLSVSFGTTFFSLVEERNIFRDPDFDAAIRFLFFPPCPELERPVERQRQRWRTLSALTFSIYLLFRSAILTAEMSRGKRAECARGSEIEIVVLHFARLQHDAYYFNERCSLPSGYLIGRPARQRNGTITSNLPVSFSTLHEYFYSPRNPLMYEYFPK